MKSNRSGSKSGFTLLELTVTMALLALLATSCMALVRTSYAAWSRHHQDNEKRQSATTLIRHLERQIRQARSVQAITPTSDNSGSLSLLMDNGVTVVWDHDAIAKEVRFGVGTATELLATDIGELTFFGYKTDMAPTTEVGLIHTVGATATVGIVRPAGVSTESWVGSAHLQAW